MKARRDEVQLRSEGALEAAELALTHIENALSAPEWFPYVRAQWRLPERLDDAIEQVVKVDVEFGAQLAKRRERCIELARKRLAQLGTHTAATRLEDLLAVLVARARLLEEVPPRPFRPLPWFACAVGGAAAAAVAAMFTDSHVEFAFATVPFVLVGLFILWRTREP